MKKSILLSALLVQAMMVRPSLTKGTNYGSINGGIPENPKKIIPNGCKEYTFYGHTVVAMSEKSAIKKCKRLAGKN